MNQKHLMMTEVANIYNNIRFVHTDNVKWGDLKIMNIFIYCLKLFGVFTVLIVLAVLHFLIMIYPYNIILGCIILSPIIIYGPQRMRDIRIIQKT